MKAATRIPRRPRTAKFSNTAPVATSLSGLTLRTLDDRVFTGGQIARLLDFAVTLAPDAPDPVDALVSLETGAMILDGLAEIVGDLDQTETVSRAGWWVIEYLLRSVRARVVHAAVAGAADGARQASRYVITFP